MASVIFEERVAVPLGLTGLADFRRWAMSAEFPATGVREFWLFDARGWPATFLLHRWTPPGFVPVGSAGGPQWSESLGCGYRLESRGNALGGQDFDLVEEERASAS